MTILRVVGFKERVCYIWQFNIRKWIHHRNLPLMRRLAVNESDSPNLTQQVASNLDKLRKTKLSHQNLLTWKSCWLGVKLKLVKLDRIKFKFSVHIYKVAFLMEALESSSLDTEWPLTLFLQVARWKRIVRFLSASLPHYQDFWCCLLMGILIQNCYRNNASRTQEGRAQQYIKTLVFSVSTFRYNGHCGVVLNTSAFVSTCTKR